MVESNVCNFDDYEYDDEDLVLDSPELIKRISSQNEGKVFVKDKERRLYEIHDSSEIEKIQRKRLDEVIDQTGCSEDLARTLLLTFDWNSVQAVEHCEDVFFRDKLNFELKFDENKEVKDFYCPSCYCECEPHEIFTMSDCGHMICKDCLCEYIKQKLGEGIKVV